MSAPRRRRWIEVLRRTAGVGIGDDKRPPTATLDDASLWAAHERATASVSDSAARAERVVATLARHRSQMDGAAERAGQVAGRVEGLAPGTHRVLEAFERLSVLALNAGLEGARAGEPLGRALLLLSDEIRNNVARGADALAEVGRAVDELAVDAGEVRRQLERARGEISELGQEAAQLSAAHVITTKSLDDLGAGLRKATGIDPEMARLVALATDHARGLMNALSALSSAAPGAQVLLALRPVMGPLVRILGEIEVRSGDDEERGGGSEGAS
jgi:methyl-accepting chemotaxis protein